MSLEAPTSPNARGLDPVLSESRATSVRTVIVDRERLLAEALEVVLAAKGITVSAITSPGPDLLEEIRRHAPDVVILGVDDPTAADIRRGETIVDASPSTRVLLVASSIDRSNALRVARARLHCILKRASVEELVRATRSLAIGGVPLRYGYVPTSVEETRDAIRPTRPALTPRELEVLELVATGATGRSIARELGITENTVRTHSQSILGKLRVHSRLEAAAYALRSGLVRLPSQGTGGLAS
jgi:DNA-binding NarL/FixJ family response regulator